MKMNQKVGYGFACLFELAKNPNEYTDAAQLSKARTIPHAYTQKVLQALSHAGLLFSQKGSGYRLARPLRYITALEVINALSREDVHGSDYAEMLINQRINETLASVTLETLSVAA